MSIAVIVPVRDAAHNLNDCVEAIRGQTRSPDEVLLVVGPSNDASLDVAQHLASADPRVRVLANPSGDRGSALNVGIAGTTQLVVAMVDAQARMAHDYLETAVRVLEASGADVVGGPMLAVGETPVGRALALALRSRFGVGGSQFHFTGRSRDVDSVYLGAYRRSAFERVGGYNSALLRTEDDDLNARIRDAGMRIRLDPDIRSTYLGRNRLGEIWRQYQGYGYWKVALATIRPSSIRLRHVVPLAFVAGIGGLAVASVITGRPLLLIVIAPYVLGAAGTALIAPATDWKERALLPVVLATMHIAYGWGSLTALPRWVALRRKARQGAQDALRLRRNSGETSPFAR